MSSAEGVISTIPTDTYGKIKSYKVKDMSILRGVSLKATSKIHKFKPPVLLEEALRWLLEQEQQTVQNLDFSFIFENSCALHFHKGKFLEFDDLTDEDED